MLRAIMITASIIIFASYVPAFEQLTEHEREIKLKETARQNVENAREVYLNKFNKCFLAGENNKISIPYLKNKGLTEDESKIALLYLSSKNYKSCVGNAMYEYSMAVNLARYFNVNGYSLKDDPELGKSVSLADSLAIDEMKYSANYFQIPENKRKKIESDEALRKVFGIKSQRTE